MKDDGSVVSVSSVCERRRSQQIHNLKVVQPAGPAHTYTHGGELSDHRQKGVIVSNFIPTAVFFGIDAVCASTKKQKPVFKILPPLFFVVAAAFASV